jgi:hypothetical protein
MTCTGTGVWDNDPPVCEAEVVEEPDSCGAVQAQCLQLAQDRYNNAVTSCQAQMPIEFIWMCNTKVKYTTGEFVAEALTNDRRNCDFKYNICDNGT